MTSSRSLLKRACAALTAAALAFAGASPALADNWSPSEDDALLLELRYRQYRLGDTLRGYQTPGGVCIDMADLIQAMDLPIRLDKKSRRATGWLFAEDQTFVLDRDSSRVQNMNSVGMLGAGDIRDTPEGWCADAKALSSWFGVTFKPDLGNLAVGIETERSLPFIAALERKSRAARLRPNGGTFDLARLTKVEEPYRSWRTPSVDVLVRAGWRADGRSGSAANIQYEAYATGEILGTSFDARLASDSDGVPERLRMRAYRVDPDGALFGPLQATQAALGDVETFAGALTGQSAVGRGLFVSNRPIARPARFSVTTLRGELPNGWDAELYRNGQLLAFQSGRGDGRYEFPDVELRFGENLLEVVLYGPQGQIRRERTDYPVGPASIPAGKTWFWAGALEEDRDLIDFRRRFKDPLTGWRWGVGVERGIDKQTTAGIGAQSLMLKGKRHNYLEATLTRGIGPLLVELAGAQELGNGSGQAVQAQAVGRSGRVNVQADVLWAFGGYESEVVEPRASRAFGLKLDTELRFGDSSVPVQFGARRSQGRNGQSVNEWLTRVSLVRKGLSVTGELSGRHTQGKRASRSEDGLAWRLLANSRIGRVRLRGDAKFRLTGERKGFESAEMTADTALTRRSDVRATVDYVRNGGRVNFGLGYVHQFDRFALRADGNVSNRGDMGLGLSLAMSFGPDPVDGGWRMSGEKLAQFGHAAVTVFRDENGDGVRQAGEGTVEGVEIATASSLEQARTNTNGRAVVSGLRPFAPVLVNIDASSVEDPLLQPKGRGVVIVPRPGIAAEVLLALAPTGEIEGRLYGTDGEPREGVTIELVDPRGHVAAQAMSEYDGYFLLDQVTYGDYRLRVSQASAAALGVGSELGVAVRLDNAKPTVNLGPVHLAVAARAKVALAP